MDLIWLDVKNHFYAHNFVQIDLMLFNFTTQTFLEISQILSHEVISADRLRHNCVVI